MRILSTLFAGLLFGTGLILSGMANPTKVQNFLDVFGTWDPSLAFVMGGAILVTAPGFWFVQKRSTPFFHDMFHLSTRKDVDARLLTGAALFGVGWGLGGLCPGPVDVTTICHNRRPRIRTHNARGNVTCQVYSLTIAQICS